MLSVAKCCGSKPPVIGAFLGRQRASQVLTGRRSWLVMRLLLSGGNVVQSLLSARCTPKRKLNDDGGNIEPNAKIAGSALKFDFRPYGGERS